MVVVGICSQHRPGLINRILIFVGIQSSFGSFESSFCAGHGVRKGPLYRRDQIA